MYSMRAVWRMRPQPHVSSSRARRAPGAGRRGARAPPGARPRGAAATTSGDSGAKPAAATVEASWSPSAHGPAPRATPRPAAMAPGRDRPEPWRRAPAPTHAAARPTMARRASTRPPRGPAAAASLRGSAEERDAERPDEAGRGEPGGQRERRRWPGANARLSAGRRDPGRFWSSAWNVSHSLTKPFSGGSAGDGHRADEEARGGPRHPLDEPAQRLHVARAGGVQRRRRRRGTAGP